MGNGVGEPLVCRESHGAWLGGRLETLITDSAVAAAAFWGAGLARLGGEKAERPPGRRLPWVAAVELLALAALACALAGPASGAVQYVDDSYPADNPLLNQWTTIQKGINASSPGDQVYVFSGTYAESVVVKETVSIVGESRTGTIIDPVVGNGFTVIANNVNLSTFTVRGSVYGVSISGGLLNNLTIDSVDFEANTRGLNVASSSNVEVRQSYFGNHSGFSSYGIFASLGTGLMARNNTFVNNYYGVFLASTQGAVVRDSTISLSRYGVYLSQTRSSVVDKNWVSNASFSGYGVLLTGDHDSTISSNNVTDVTNYGIYISSSFNLTITGNWLTNNTYDLHLLPSLSTVGTYFGHSITPSNLVEGKPVRYYVNTSNVTVPPGAGWVGAYNVTNIAVGFQNITRMYSGIWLMSVRGAVIDGINFTSSVTSTQYAVFAGYSTGLLVQGVNHTGYGTGLYSQYGDNVTMQNSKIVGTPGAPLYYTTGAYVYSTTNARVLSNTVDHAQGFRIYLSENALVEANQFNDSDTGVYLIYGSWSRVNSNTFTNSSSPMTVSGYLPEHYQVYIAANNSWEGRPLRSFVNASGPFVPANIAWVLMSNVTSATVGRYYTPNATTQAAVVAFSSGVTFSDAIFNRSSWGFYIIGSNNTTVAKSASDGSDMVISVESSADIAFANGTWTNVTYEAAYVSSTSVMRIENATVGGVGASYVVECYSSPGLTVRNVTATGFWSFAYADVCDSLTFDRVNATSFVGTYGDTGVYLWNVSYANISNSSFSWYQYGIYASWYNWHLAVTNVTVAPVRREGIISESGTTGDLTIQSSRFEGEPGVSTNGVHLSDVMAGVLLSGLNITGFDVGVFADPMSGIIISGSQINNTSVGILFYTITASTITGNTISDTTLAAIRVEASSAVVVSLNTVQRAGTVGINVVDSTGVQVNGNQVQGGPTGIRFSGGRDSAAASNTVNGTTERGIEVTGGHENSTFESNTVTNGYDGFYIDQVSFMRLYSNSMSGNTYNFHMESYWIGNFYHTIPTNNTVDGEAIYYRVNGTGGIIPSSAGLVYLVNWSSATVSGVSIANEYVAIRLYETSDITIIGASLSDSFYGVWATTATNLTLQNSGFNRTYSGAYLEYVTNVRFVGNSVNGSQAYGLYGFFAWNLTIEASSFNGTSSYGALLYYTDSGRFVNNRFSNMTYIALMMYASSNDVLFNNTFTDNWGSFGLQGWDLAHFSHTIATNNTIEGRPIYHYVNTTGVTPPSGAGMVILANVTGATVSGAYLDRVGAGVLLYRSRFVNISDTTFARGVNGIHLIETSDVWVWNVTTNASACCVYSLAYVDYLSSNFTIRDSVIPVAYSIVQAYYAENILVRNLTLGDPAYGSVGSAISTSGRVNNVTVENNTFRLTYYTVYLYGYGASDMATNVTVANNTFGGNTYYPLYMGTSWAANITFYHNSFNITGPWDYFFPYDEYNITVFSRPYPVGGNHWSTHTSPDDYSGASQSGVGADGMVDTPFSFGVYGGYDAYPLVDPWPPSVRLVSPPNGSAIQPGATLDFNVSRYFDVITASIDGGLAVPFLPPFDINTSGWSSGTHIVWVNASDITGVSVSGMFVFEVDTAPPSIAALSPSPGGTYAAGTLLNYTITDAHLAPNATWDAGGGQQPFGSPWNISTAGWADGAYNITVRAWDTAGNMNSSTFAYTIDADAPVVALNSPANNSVVQAGTLIDLTITDTSFQNASWNNGSGWNALAAPFDISTAGWSEGTYTVTVSAEDAFGRVTVGWGSFTIDNTAPSVVLNAPSNNSYFQPGTTIDLGVTDAHFQNASWSLGGPWASLASPFDISTGGWSDGPVTLYVSATDTAGNSRAVSFSFTVDSVRPAITLDAPVNNSVAQAGTTLAFSIADTNPFTATWSNGGAPTALGSPYDISTTGWADATYTVTVTATDGAGNARSLWFNFTIDSTLPSVSLSSPANNSVIKAGTALDLSVSDLHLSNVTYNNGSGAVTLSSPFDIVTGGWPDGPTDVVVVATDTAGNARTLSFHFTFDSTPPTVTLDAPSNGSSIQSGVTLEFSVSDTNFASATWNNGGANSSLAAPFDVSTAGWSEGLYSVTLRALDMAGNERILVVIVRIDDTAPSISLNQPANGSTFGAGTLIDFGIADASGFSASWDNGTGGNALASPFDVDTTGWADGTFTVWVNATDAAGNLVFEFFVFDIDNTFPAVILQGPANNSVFTPGTTIDFDVVDNDLNTVTWDNGSGTQTLAAPYDISTTGWADGHVNVTIVATDNSSHTVNVVFHFIIDSVAPAVALDAPANGSVIRAGTQLNLSVGDLNIGSVTWNNGSGPVALSSPYDIPTAGWPDGAVSVTVTATDLAGNALVRVYTFTMDSTPPSISLSSPSNNSVVVPGTTVVLAISDAHSFNASWDNGSGAASFATPYNISTAAWADGTIDILVQATDIAGNALQRTFRLTLDSVAPSVSLAGPANGSVIPPGTTLDFAVSDAHLAGATWDTGGGPTALAAPYDVSTSSWSDGTVTVWVNATDTAGNAASRSFVFTVDATPPSITLAAPSNNSVVQPGQAVDLAVSDANGLSSVTWDNGTGSVALASPYDISTAGWPEGSTNITVIATDVAGNALVRVFQLIFDATPPSVTLASPANGSLFQAGAAIDLSISDLNGLAGVAWDNGGGPVSLASPYDISTAGWADGNYTVTVTATDVAGNAAVRSYSFTVDSTGPTITLVSPSNGSVIARGTVLDITVSDTHGVANASWDNGTGAVAFASPYDINTTTWPDGSTTVTVAATDAVGNTRVAVFGFTLDGTAPTVALDSPSNGSVILPGTTLALTVTDPYLAGATWNNGSGAVALASPFDIATAGWADGNYTINITATDSAGNIRVALFQFTLDGTAPLVTLNSPANNSYMAAGGLIDLNVTDANLASATWNNGSGPSALASPFDISTAGWPDGSVTVTVNATDLAGNSVVRTFSFTLDSTAPTVSLVAPSNNSFVSEGTTLDFDASDLNLVSVTWNNGSGPNALTTPFDVGTDNWADGPRNVTVVATDAAGNSVARVFSFTFDSTLPLVVLNSPSNNSIITAGTPINLTVTDLNLDTVVWNNGSGSNAFPSPFDISTAGWADGVYDVTVTATDLAGNQVAFVARFTFDTTPPVITLSAPANNSHIRAGQVLDLQITDLTAVSVTWDTGGGPNTVASPYEINTSAWIEGDTNVTIIAVDAVGNTATRLLHFVVDNTPPSITPINFANNSVKKRGDSLDMVISDTYLSSATWDNGDGQSSFVSQWNISTSPWTDGAYDLVIRATDQAGNVLQRTYRIVIDSVAPTITLNVLNNGSHIIPGVTVINFSIADANLGTVTWEEETSGQQPFSTPWNISTAGWTDGLHNVTVIATDLAGNQLYRVYRFTADSVVPVVSLNFPATNNSYQVAGFTINFTISDLNLASNVTWDIGQGPQPFASQWNITTTGWPDALYSVAVVAWDLAGNRQYRVYRLTFDSTLPSVVLNSPADDAHIRAGTAINLTVSDANLDVNAVVWNNGGANQTLAAPWQIGTGSWADGQYTVSVYAADLAGNLRAAVFRFTVDSTAPLIVLVAPANNSHIAAGTVLNLSIAEVNLATATWDRGTGASMFAVAWNITTTAAWTDGDHNVTVTVVDRAGNAATATFHFVLDSTPPAIADPSWNGSFVAAGTPLNVSVLEANLVWFAWTNGAGQSGNGSAASVAIPTSWADGPYTVVLTAQDLAGHRTVRTALVTVDSLAPVISGVVPANGSFVTPGTAIQFAASDTNLLSVTWQRDGGAVLPANGSGPYTISTAAWGDGNWSVRLLATDRAGLQAVVTLQLVTDMAAPAVPALLDLTVDEDILQTLDASAASDGPNPLDPGAFVWNLSGRLSALLTGPVVQYTWDDPGNYTVQLTVTDRAGNAATRTIAVRVRDLTPPVAVAGADQVVDEGTLVTLDGSSSSDNGAVQSFLWTQLAGPAVGSSPSGPLLIVTPTVPGTYVFELRVTDGAGLSATDTLTVTALDRTPPAIVLPALPVVNEGATVTFNASATTDNDPTAAGNLSFAWTFTYGEPQFLSGATPSWTFALPGEYLVTLAATDPSGNEATSSFTLRVNDVPSLSSLPPGSITIPGTYQGVLPLVDADAGDTHNVTVRSPSGMAVTQIGGNLALEWQPEVIGFYVVNFTISDGWSSVNFSFNLTVGRAGVGNRPPVFTSNPPTEAPTGAQYAYLPQVSDADGDSLLFGLDIAPPGMTIAPSTGRIAWSHGYGPTSGYRLDDVRLWAWDGVVYAYQNFTIRFVPAGNAAPVFLAGAPSSAEVEVGDAIDLPFFSYLSDADDPSGNLTLSASSGASGTATVTVVGSGEGLALRVQGVAEGSATVTLTLRDPSGATATQTIQVNVRPPGTTGAGDTGLGGLLLPLIAVAGVGGGGVLFIMMRRRKGEEGAEVTQAVAAGQVAAVEPVAVRAPPEAVTVAAAGAAGAALAAAAAAPEKATTYAIEGLFVIYKDGRLLYSKTDMGLQKFEDPELVSSMFTAVQSFIKDSFAAEGELNKMGYGDNQIIIERGKHIFMAAIIYGEPDQEFMDKVRDVIEGIELSYAGVVEEWDGMMDAFSDMEAKFAPILALTVGVSRREVQLATTKQEVRMLSELEFFQGFVRLKVGIKNNTPMVITKVTVDIEYNEDVLRLGRVEPAAYRTAGAKVLLGVLNPGEKSSVAYYFDPQICTESQIDGVCRYRDASGVLHTVSMKTRRAEVVCPLFFTKEHANTAMLKRLVEAELTEKDAKVFEIQKVPPYIKYKDIFDLVKTVVNAHDVQMVREFTRFNPFQGEAWFYGETKVKGYKIVIRTSVIEEGKTIEFFAASTNMKAITGLLAEFNHTLNSTIIEKYSDLKIALLFDNEVKAEIERKSLMSRMSSEELEGGETDQDEGGGGAPPPEPNA